jgi:hypothetical protein
MMQINRRMTLRLMGGAGLTATALPVLSLSARAEEDLYVPTAMENFKRGTIHTLDPKTRGLVVVWPDLGRVKMKASDLVVKDTVSDAYASLKEGQIVDIHWYDYMDFLIAKTTPASTAQAKDMVAQGARIEGIPGTTHQIRLWSMAGMCTRVDTTNNLVFLINASGGEPDRPSPDSGEVIQQPQIVTAKGKSALAALKPGDLVTTVFSVQTALKVKIIR